MIGFIQEDKSEKSILFSVSKKRHTVLCLILHKVYFVAHIKDLDEHYVLITQIFNPKDPHVNFSQMTEIKRTEIKMLLKEISIR